LGRQRSLPEFCFDQVLEPVEPLFDGVSKRIYNDPKISELPSGQQDDVGMQPACGFTGVTLVSDSRCAFTWPIRRPGELWTSLLAILVSSLVLTGLTGCGFSASGSTGGALLALPNPVAFGTVPIGQTATSKVSLLNQTSAPIAIAQLSIAGQSFSLVNQSNVPINIAAGATYSFDIGFMPQQTSNYSGQLTATSAGGATVAQVPITGAGGGGSASTPTLTISPASLAFGNVGVNTASALPVTLTSTGTAPVAINSATSTGTGFTLSGVTFPVTLNPTQSVTLNVQFDPAAAGAVTGQVTIQSNSSTNGTAMIGLTGTGTGTAGPAALSALSCSNASMTGAGSDACTVTLSGPAGSGGLSVTLVSSNAAVTVPTTVVVPANASSAGFTATVSTVSTAQAVTLTASAGGVSKTFALQLNPAVPTLTISPLSLAFGNVTVSTPSALPVTLTSTGTAPVTINSASLSGTGFTMSGATFPVTLNPTLAITLDVQFDPAAAGAVTGQLTIQSNSSTNGTVVINLTGTGEISAHYVGLSWEAPASSADPVAGYHVYRSTGGSSPYVLLNSSLDILTTYTDNNVVSGASYDYIVKSVDSAGVESSPSNQAAATIP
jgi:Abnormal spindle-like microcephaly-assoc'd, ASPM-SPD-2-Hydin